MSLKTRLSLLSVGLLLLLLVVSGVASYLALGAYQRINEAGALDRRYEVTLREFRLGAATIARPGVAGCTVARLAGTRPIVDGTLAATFAQDCVAPAFAGQQVTAAVLTSDGTLLACSRTATVSDGCDPSAADYPAQPPGDYAAAARGAQRRYYLTGSGTDERLVVLHPFPSASRPLAVVELSESTETLQRTQRSLLLVLAVAGAALVLLAALVTPLLVGRALLPLRRVTDASTAMAAGDLGQRVAEPPTTDEVGRLSRAFNQMAAAVQRALHVREESEAGMRSFVSDASHELRTPLTTIQGQLDVLALGAGEGRLPHESLDAMQREVTRMSALVEDLLTLTRLESAGAGRATGAVDLDRLVAETVDEQSVRSPGQQVEVEPAPPGQAVVQGDAEQLRRVVENLATNAVKYAPGGRHRWKTRVDADSVALSLSDEGPGIPPDVLPRIFDRFYRGPDVVPRAPGSGLGLAIVRTIVETHGGRVEATSTGGGSTFTVTLPRGGARPEVSPGA